VIGCISKEGRRDSFALYFSVYANDVEPDPHHFGKLDPHPDPLSHQIKIRISQHQNPHQMKISILIRIKVISWLQNRIRIRINLQMTSQNVWNMSLIEHFCKGMNIYLEARIWIRIQIRIRVKSRIWIRIK
jgi:hypothetical protein